MHRSAPALTPPMDPVLARAVERELLDTIFQKLSCMTRPSSQVMDANEEKYRVLSAWLSSAGNLIDFLSFLNASLDLGYYPNACILSQIVKKLFAGNHPDVAIIFYNWGITRTNSESAYLGSDHLYAIMARAAGNYHQPKLARDLFKHANANNHLGKSVVNNFISAAGKNNDFELAKIAYKAAADRAKKYGLPVDVDIKNTFIHAAGNSKKRLRHAMNFLNKLHDDSSSLPLTTVFVDRRTEQKKELRAPLKRPMPSGWDAKDAKHTPSAGNNSSTGPNSGLKPPMKRSSAVSFQFVGQLTAGSAAAASSTTGVTTAATASAASSSSAAVPRL